MAATQPLHPSMKIAADYPENRGAPMKTRAEARVVWIRKSSELAVALLVLLAAAAGARVVAAHAEALWQGLSHRLGIDDRGFQDRKSVV